MGQFCCSNNVGVATGAGNSLWVGLDVHRLQKVMALRSISSLKSLLQVCKGQSLFCHCEVS